MEATDGDTWGGRGTEHLAGEEDTVGRVSETESTAVVLRRALLPALILGLYFGAIDVVGTLVGLARGRSRDPWEFARRVAADVLSGVLLVPAGLGEQWLRRRERRPRRDAAVAGA